MVKKLTAIQKDRIKLLLIKGYTIKGIAYLFDVKYSEVAKYWKWEKKKENIINVRFDGKHEPYYKKRR